VQNADAQQRTMRNQHLAIEPATGQKTVLIADDDPISRNIVRLMLEADKYLVLAANDGVEGMELSRSFSGRIHVLLTDVQMPNMGGAELRRQMLIERPTTRAVLMSANDSPIPGVPFLKKPFQRAELAELLSQVLTGVE
jgi:CheY-like chemotaxis protein